MSLGPASLERPPGSHHRFPGCYRRRPVRACVCLCAAPTTTWICHPPQSNTRTHARAHTHTHVQTRTFVQAYVNVALLEWGARGHVSQALVAARQARAALRTAVGGSAGPPEMAGAVGRLVNELESAQAGLQAGPKGRKRGPSASSRSRSSRR